MPNSCCAGYCTNTNIKGYQMCRFPKDSERKRIWIQNMNRTDWIPTSDARLCDVSYNQKLTVLIFAKSFVKIL